MRNSEYLDTATVADLTGLRKSTLEKWRVSRTHLPFIRVGRLVRYARTDIDAWLTSRKVQSISEKVSASSAAVGCDRDTWQASHATIPVEPKK